jgi:hypothetical protein
MSSLRRLLVGASGVALGISLALSSCTRTPAVTPAGTLSSTPPSSAAVGASSSAPPTVSPTGSPSAAQYFGDGKTYDAWVIAINRDGTLTIGLVHHLTGQAAKDYLTSHGQTIPPEGIPNDYINVDTYVHKRVMFSSTATVTTNPQGLAQSMSASAFLATYLPSNLAKPLAAGNRDTYPGAPHYYGPLYALTFQHDVIVSVSQIFEP